LLQNIDTNQLFFNNIFNLNDPFEGIFRYRISTDKQRFKEFYLKHIDKNKSNKWQYYFENKEELNKLLNRTFEFRFKNNSICSFSEEDCLTNILMWSHYTNKHSGACLMFDETLKFATPPEFNSKGTVIAHPTGPHKVSYTKEYIDEDPIQRTLNQRNFLTTKFDIWEYEREHRYIAPRSGAYYFNDTSLVEIVLGLRFDSALEKALICILKQKPHGVKLRKVTKMTSDFQFAFREINYVK